MSSALSEKASCDGPVEGGKLKTTNGQSSGVAGDASSSQKYGGLSKRAYRRHIVKEWERKQKEASRRQQAHDRDALALSSRFIAGPSGRPLPGVAQPFQFFFNLPVGDHLGAAAETTAAGDAAVVDEEFIAELERGALVRGSLSPQGADGLPPDVAAASPTAVLPLAWALQSAPVKELHVKKLRQGELLPFSPLDGADLNQAPANYLSWDPVYGVHKHAPGFERNQALATEALLSSAAQEIQDTCTNIDVISSGAAVKDIFEAAFAKEPLALRVHRIGPTVFLEAEPKVTTKTVGDARRAALLGKALYHMRSQVDVGLSSASSAVVPATQARVSCVSSREADQQHLHSFSHVLRWRLDNLNVLLGVDPPLLTSSSDGVEMMLRLEDEASGAGGGSASSNASSNASTLRESLSCWFDATLANVPHVGVCIHREGRVQSFRLQKVQDLLSMVEGKLVTSALSFTKNVLRWIVSQCTNDCVDYVVLRNAASNELELYECQQAPWIASSGGESPQKKPRCAADGDGVDTAAEGSAAASGALDWALANMCFHVGMLLFSTQPGKEEQVLPLFARCFSLFSTHFMKAEARDSMLNIGEKLADVAIKATRAKDPSFSHPPSSSSLPGAADGGSAKLELPNAYREPLVLLQQMLQAALTVAGHERASRSPFLSAALSVLARVVASLAAIASMALSRFIFLKSGLAHPLPETLPRVRGSVLKNLLQVVVEGLLSISKAVTLTAEAQTSVIAGQSEASSSALVDTRIAAVDAKLVGDAMLELLGDVATACMQSDETANFVREVAQRVAEREGELAPALQWLLDVTADVVGMSFSALKFYSKNSSASKRILIKTSNVHYLVGRHYAATDRHTKALESLMRSKEIFAAAQKCTATDCNPVLSTLPMPSPGVLARQALASVYCRMAKARRDAQPTVAVRAAVDCCESVVAMTPEEDRMLCLAMEEMGAEDPAVLLLYVQRAIDHRVALHAGSRVLIDDAQRSLVDEPFISHLRSMITRAVDLGGATALAALCDMRLLVLALRLGPKNCPPLLAADAAERCVALSPASLEDVQLMLLQCRTDLQRAVTVSLLFPPHVSRELCRIGTLAACRIVAMPGYVGSDAALQLASRLLRVSCGVSPQQMKPIYSALLAQTGAVGLSDEAGLRSAVLKALRDAADSLQANSPDIPVTREH
jgi:hypothetical protein